MLLQKKYSTYSVSNILIAVSFIATALVINSPELYIYGKNSFFLDQGIYHIFILQIFTGTFIHGGIIHLLFNSIFIYYFGNIIEDYVGKKMYIALFLITIFVGMYGLILFSGGNTVGISGFAMSLLSFYTLFSYFNKSDDYKGGITAIIVNIGIGLSPGISFIGHLSGAIVGFVSAIIYIYIIKN